MEIASGRWYCTECYLAIEQDETAEAGLDPEMHDFIASHRARLEFVRYLVRSGVLNESSDEEHALSKS